MTWGFHFKMSDWDLEGNSTLKEQTMELTMK